jgi:hypothetical protein
VPDLATLAALPAATALGGLGGFLDDDGRLASIASFVATAGGAPGPVVNGLQTWLDITEGPMPPSVLPNEGPAPTALPATRWGQEKQVTRVYRWIDGSTSPPNAETSGSSSVLPRPTSPRGAE